MVGYGTKKKARKKQTHDVLTRVNELKEELRKQHDFASICVNNVCLISEELQKLTLPSDSEREEEEGEKESKKENKVKTKETDDKNKKENDGGDDVGDDDDDEEEEEEEEEEQEKKQNSKKPTKSTITSTSTTKITTNATTNVTTKMEENNKKPLLLSNPNNNLPKANVVKKIKEDIIGNTNTIFKVKLSGGEYKERFDGKTQKAVQKALTTMFPGRIIWASSSCDFVVIPNHILKPSVSSNSRLAVKGKYMTYDNFIKMMNGQTNYIAFSKEIKKK